MINIQNIFKKNRQYLIVGLIIILAIFLLTNKLILWGLIVFAAGMVILGIQQLISLNVKVSQFQSNIDALDEKNNNLLKQNLKLKEENSFLKDRHFQITQIKSILELNLFEIDTKFTRSVSKLEELNGRNIKYFGSLNVALTAKYGIDCKELRFKYDAENDVLSVADINPRFLSFGNRKLEWDFFEIFEQKNIIPLTGKRWMASDDLQEYAGKIKEEYRLETEKSLERGPEEFSWIHAPIKNNVESLIKILFSGLCRNIKIANNPDNSFVHLDNLNLRELSGKRTINELKE
jgi:ABC-type multidrug transport system fused ATPase/permease subunit